MKFRKKPVIIDAEQYVEEDVPVRGMCNIQTCFTRGKILPAISVLQPHVHTIHANQIVLLEVGDWIIPEPDGLHFYPCNPDIFKETYDPVKETVKTIGCGCTYVTVDGVTHHGKACPLAVAERDKLKRLLKDAVPLEVTPEDFGKPGEPDPLSELEQTLGLAESNAKKVRSLIGDMYQFPCSKCGVPSGLLCRTEDGLKLGGIVHVERGEEFRYPYPPEGRELTQEQKDYLNAEADGTLPQGQ